MITKMSKYSFLVYHKEYDSFLTQMRELGVLHVIEKQAGSPEEGSALQEKLAQSARFDKVVKEAERVIGEEQVKCAPAQSSNIVEKALEMVADFDEINEKISKNKQLQAMLEKEVDRMQLWGDFKWQSVYALRDAGYIVRFWSASDRSLEQEWMDKYNVIIIAVVGSLNYFITVTKEGEMVEMDNAERIRLPKENLSELKKEFSQSVSEDKTLEDSRRAFCFESYNTLVAAMHLTLEDVDYQKVVLNSEQTAESKVYLLEGWVPTDKALEVNAYLDKAGIYYESKQAQKEDPAPVKLHNNAFARLFHPITELYDMPSYAEWDLTPFFAPFFVMFFGLCLGDAGYGLLLIALGVWMGLKAKPDMKPIFKLVTILGIGTAIFGTVSGTLFGISLLKVDWPWIQSMKKFMLDSNQLFYASLLIGVFQIIFGMIIKAVSQTLRFGFLNSLSAWGWLIGIAGCGGTAALSMAGLIDADTAKWLYYILGGFAAIGIYLFNDIKRNPLINVGAGIWDTYNMASGLLGDILSYVRLFALGISGSVLGLVFNDLAIKMSPDIPVVGFLVSAVILIFGHGINIFMSGLGAFVHPMRLTFVEFYKNAGFEGGGKVYHPFSKRTK